MTPSTLVKLITEELQALLRRYRVSVKEHSGKFIWSELQEISFRAPAVFVSCLGWRAPTADEVARLAADGESIHRVRFIAGIVTKSNKAANTRNQQARLLSEVVTNHLARQDWNQPDVYEAADIRCEPLFVPEAERDGQSLWIVDWWHLVAFDADTVRGQLDDFITLHGDHYGDPGTHVSSQGNEMPLASDEITLPQEQLNP